MRTKSETETPKAVIRDTKGDGGIGSDPGFGSANLIHDGLLTDMEYSK